MYCDLHTHSHFSDGTDSPRQILEAAVAMGLSSVALTDHNTVAGLPVFLEAAAGRDLMAVAAGICWSGWYTPPRISARIRLTICIYTGARDVNDQAIRVFLLFSCVSIMIQQIQAVVKRVGRDFWILWKGYKREGEDLGRMTGRGRLYYIRRNF